MGAARSEHFHKSLRVILVAIITGIAGPVINWQYQSKELETVREQKKSELEMAKSKQDAEIRARRLELEQNYVTNFLERATEENVENRLRFTRYLSSLTLEPKLKSGWEKLFEQALNEKKEIENQIAKLEKPNANEEEKMEIARLKEELAISKGISTPILVEPIPLSKIQQNSACAEGSKPIISAVESRKKAGFTFSVFGFDFTPPRVFNIARWCIDDEPKVVGDVVLFGTNGDVLARLSLDQIKLLGIKPPKVNRLK